MHLVTNATVAAVLHRVGDLLELQDANDFRVRAYHRAAERVRRSPEQVAHALAEGGRQALIDMPDIGERLASTIDELVHTGTLRLLERLEGQLAPEDVFAAIPGIGDELAHRIHEELGTETLEDLEVAAHDGRLDALEGIGPERLEAVRNYLEHVLDRSSRRRSRARLQSRTESGPALEFDHGRHPLPSVSLLLDLEEQYRNAAADGRLPTIAPTRFNPAHRAWLPVWHPERDGYSFTVLFSNSARAHKLGKTRDWVVVYFARDGEEEQCTIVTEHRGDLEGRRVVRGREAECAEHYRRTQVPGDEAAAWAHAAAERLERKG